MAVQRRASQIAFILHQAEEGVSVEEVCRKAGVSMQTDYRWRKKYGGLMPSEMKRLKCSKRRPEVARPKFASRNHAKRIYRCPRTECVNS